MAASTLGSVKDGADLADRKCVPCTTKEGSDLAALSEADAEALMPKICPSWKRKDGGLERSFVSKGFKTAMAAIVAFGEAADAAGHHPDLHLTDYRTVTVRLTTHGLDGRLSINDFIVAAKLDAIPVAYSPKWARENPEVRAGKAAASPVATA